MSANTPTSLSARLKQRYNKGVSNIVPMPADLLRRAKFRNDLKIGQSAEFDVHLSPELGFSMGTGAATLNGAIAQIDERATITGYSLVLQSQISYDAISRAESNDQAFERFNSGKFLGMVESFRMREEWIALQGRQSIGKVSSAVGGGVFEISKDSWCPTIWASIKGAVLEAFDALDGTTQHNGDVVVSSVDLATRRVTLTGTSAAIVQNDHLFFKGTHNANRIGLMSIAKNVGSQYGISAATHALWSANFYDVGTSALNLGKILQAAAKSAIKGAVGQKLVCYVPVTCFQGLVADEAALVTHGASKSTAENGFEFLKFLGATGVIEVVPHLYMKEGEFVLFPEEYLYVIGSTEATNRLDKSGDILFDLEGVMAKELRLFSDTCGVFCEKPGYITYGYRSDGLSLAE